jgi:hypothetical protein
MQLLAGAAAYIDARSLAGVVLLVAVVFAFAFAFTFAREAARVQTPLRLCAPPCAHAHARLGTMPGLWSLCACAV